MPEYIPGLAGIPAARSKISYLDGQKGILEYRGIRIEILAEKSRFVETAYLLLFGKLPARPASRSLARTSFPIGRSSIESRIS